MPARRRKPAVPAGPVPVRRRRAVVIPAEPLRFAHGLRRVDPEHSADPRPEAGEPTVHIDLVRPDDLVALSVDAVNCELLAGGAQKPRLRPIDGTTARLVVRYAFQHTTEEAVYEGFVPGHPIRRNPSGGPYPTGEDPEFEPPAGAGDGPDARPPVPVRVIPARSSRLVFAVPATEAIEFSTAGLLDAMGRLELVVHSLALPGDAPDPYPPTEDGPFLRLPGGLIGRIGVGSIEVVRARAGDPRRVEPATTAGLARQASELRQARGLLQTRSAYAAARTALPEGAGPAPAVRVDGRVVDTRPLFGPGGLIDPPVPRPRPRRTLSRPPTEDETAIEAPYRLVISPSTEARWAHAAAPVPAADQPGHVELWHSRLGVAKTQADGSVGTDEVNRRRRIVRAVWARDRDYVGDTWQDPTQNLGHDNLPFRMSLDRADRHMLVRQSAETWPGRRLRPIPPVPVAAEALWLSGLGAWLDLHGQWDTDPYSAVPMSSILAWDHLAPLGRDQYVRVVYPGHFHCFGHKVALVKVTERKMKDAAPSVAGLYQRKFLVIGERSRTYNSNDFPFQQITINPGVSPTLDEPTEVHGDSQDEYFWPRVGGAKFVFTIEGLDREGRPQPFPMPLLWVSDAYNGPVPFSEVEKEYDGSPDRFAPLSGAKVAFARSYKGGDTSVETQTIGFRGTESLGTSTPRMSSARVLLPAVQQLSGAGPIPISYHPLYKTDGLPEAPGTPGATNSGELWAQVNVEPGQQEHPTDPVIALPQLKFGAGAPSGSDKAGGFLSPDLPIRGLSRLSGTVGDTNGMTTQTFDPVAFLKGAAPKLFGIVNLVDLVEAVTGEPLKVPSVVSEALDRVAGFLADLERAKAAVLMAVDEAQKLVQRAAGKTSELQAEAQAALSAAQGIRDTLVGLVDTVPGLIQSLTDKTQAEVEAAIASPFASLRTAVADLEELGPKLPPFIRHQIAALTGILDDVLKAADFVEDVYRFVNGFDPSSVQVRFRFEWHPQVASWPSPAHPFLGLTDPIIELKPDSLVLSVEGQASGKGQMGVEALAEIRDFTLHLLPGAPLVRVPFDHLSFKAGSSGKPEVDVVLGDTEFVGMLSFVEVIKDLIPLDGFSDPPYLEVDSKGLTAGFTLTLPTVAIGVFSLSNMSLGADVQVPFLGKAVTVGFQFCTRERPFTLAVVFLGGGGWFGIRLSPDGLDLLELGLEAGACLAVDFGVASGSISAMIGIYMRLEGSGGSLTGYFRLRGEVDVLGLVSASIELYMELTYDFGTGKMIGRATITVEVSVLCFSATVSISAERKFAGSNGDPSFKQVMAAESGTSPAWSTYCLAFAEES